MMPLANVSDPQKDTQVMIGLDSFDAQTGLYPCLVHMVTKQGGTACWG